MAILRSNDGRFYEVADDQLEGKLIPSDQIKDKLASVGVGPSEGPVGCGPQMMVPGTGGQVVIQIYTSAGGGYGAPGDGDVEAHGYGGYDDHHHHFDNHWHRNCFRNHHHHDHH